MRLGFLLRLAVPASVLLLVSPALAAYDEEARLAWRAGCKDVMDEDRKMARAEKACTKLLGRSGLSTQQRGFALYARGTLRIASARYPEGLADLEEAVPLLPSFGKVLESRARAYEMNGLPAKALADYRAALALDPSLYMAEFAMQQMLQRCPQGTYEGSACATSASPAPVPPAMQAEPPRTLSVADVPNNEVADPSRCEPGAEISVSATIMRRAPPHQGGYPWTLELGEWQGGCHLQAIQTDVEPPPACSDGATAAASGKVFDQVLVNPGDLRCSTAGEAQQSSGWFAWLWGREKPTQAPPAPAAPAAPSAPPSPAQAPSPPLPAARPATTVQLVGKEIVLEAPSDACFAATDDETVQLFFKNVAQPTAKDRWRILAGYKDCDTPLADFRGIIGAYAVVDDMKYDDPQREAGVWEAPFTICEALGARADLSIDTLDETVTAKLADAAQKAVADPQQFSMEPIVIGMHGPVCATVRAWGGRPYMLFVLVFTQKKRVIFLTASAPYSGPQSAQEAFERIVEMISHMTVLNYEP